MFKNCSIKLLHLLVTVCVVISFPKETVAQSYISNKSVYVTQMHVHGWSNHNGALNPGSHQYHNWQADSVGVNVLWWTEHHPIYIPDTGFYHLNGGSIVPTTLDIINLPTNFNTEPNKWEAIVNDGTSTVTLNSDTLSVTITSLTSNTDYKKITYAPRSSIGRVKHFNFVQPLETESTLKLLVKPEFTNDNNGRFQINAQLSWHHRQSTGQDVIVYDFIEGAGTPTTTTNNNDTAWVQYPLNNNAWQTLNLDLNSAAATLVHGKDNTLSGIEFNFISRNGDQFKASLLDVMLIPEMTNTDTIVKREKDILNVYNNLYHVKNILGVELSSYDHINGFFPDTTSDRFIFRGKTSGNLTNWVNRVHNVGGVTSYNHIFGTNWTIDSIGLQDYRTDTIANYLLQNNAFDTDILEVGYLNRGGGDLEHHFKTWDILTANGLFMYGNGVSDSHGSLWMDSNNLFHTYIWASDSTDYNLLQSLSLGKMYFGIYKNYSGEFYYTLGDMEMGDRGFTVNASAYPDIYLSPYPSGCKIKLTQALIDTSTQLTYIHNQTVIDTASPPLIDTSFPSFVRIGVYDSLDNPLVFGQPIVILGTLVGLAENENSNTDHQTPDITAFPNPVKNLLNIEINIKVPSIYHINFVDANSNIVKSIDTRYFYKRKYGYSLNVTDYSSGSYYIQVLSRSNANYKKIIIE
jgi:type IX secretion system substrate protein